jgi:hypothetical protein
MSVIRPAMKFTEVESLIRLVEEMSLSECDWTLKLLEPETAPSTDNFQTAYLEQQLRSDMPWVCAGRCDCDQRRRTKGRAR